MKRRTRVLAVVVAVVAVLLAAVEQARSAQNACVECRAMAHGIYAQCVADQPAGISCIDLFAYWWNDCSVNYCSE